MVSEALRKGLEPLQLVVFLVVLKVHSVLALVLLLVDLLVPLWVQQLVHKLAALGKHLEQLLSIRQILTSCVLP